jgi:hypothetical protein
LDERSRNLIARQESRMARSQRLDDQVGHPWPAWAHQLAQELERDNAAGRESALGAPTAGNAGRYVPPVHEPYVETAALLQFERDRLAVHRLDVAVAEREREARLRQAAAHERARVGAGRSEPVPLRRLGVMLAVEQAAWRKHPAPGAPDVLPLSFGTRRGLDHIKERVDRLLTAATAVYEPERLAGLAADIRNDRILRDAEQAAIERLPPVQRGVYLAMRRGASIEQAALDHGVSMSVATALHQAASRKVQP